MKEPVKNWLNNFEAFLFFLNRVESHLSFDEIARLSCVFAIGFHNLKIFDPFPQLPRRPLKFFEAAVKAGADVNLLYEYYPDTILSRSILTDQPGVLLPLTLLTIRSLTVPGKLFGRMTCLEFFDGSNNLVD